MSDFLKIREEVDYLNAFRRAVADSGKTLVDLAHELKTDRTAIGRYLKGTRKIPTLRLSDFGLILGIPEQIVSNLKYLRMEWEPYNWGTFDELIRSGYNLQWLIDQVNKILENDPPALIPDDDDGSNDYGDEAQWELCMKKYPNSIFAVIDSRTDEMCGYWQVLSLQKRVFDEGVKRENINARFNYEQTIGFELVDEHYFYIVDMFRRIEYRNVAVYRHLRNGFQRFIYELAKNGQFAIAFFANASSYEALRLCKKAKFCYVGEHLKHRQYIDEADPGLGVKATVIYKLESKEKFMESIIFDYADTRELYAKRFR